MIDCHTHIGRNQHINSSVDDLLRSMDQSYIDKSLVFAGDINDCPNGYLLSQVLNHKDRLYAVACAPLDKTTSLNEKKEIIKTIVKSEDFVAVKFYLGYEHVYPTDPEIYEMMNLISESKLTAIFHCGDCLSSIKNAKLRYSHPLNIDDVAVDFPDTNIVIAHMGFPWHRDAAEVCYKNANVFADISGFVYGEFHDEDVNKFKKVIEEFIDISGYGKLLFGSDFPISNQSNYKNITTYELGDFGLNEFTLEQTAKKAFKLL